MQESKLTKQADGTLRMELTDDGKEELPGYLEKMQDTGHPWSSQWSALNVVSELLEYETGNGWEYVSPHPDTFSAEAGTGWSTLARVKGIPGWRFFDNTIILTDEMGQDDHGMILAVGYMWYATDADQILFDLQHQGYFDFTPVSPQEHLSE